MDNLKKMQFHKAEVPTSLLWILNFISTNECTILHIMYSLLLLLHVLV